MFLCVFVDVTEEKFMLYKEGVFFDSTCSNDVDKLNHAVLVVGYGTNGDSNYNETDFWIVKNSWGPSWGMLKIVLDCFFLIFVFIYTGEQGYIRMSRNRNNMCGIATSASYPVVA
jgi:cathepsin L